MNRMTHCYRQRLWLFSALIVWGATLLGSSARAQASAPFFPSAPTQPVLFLPIVQSSGSTPTPNPNPNPNPTVDNFIQRDKKTASPSIVVDARGGTHLAYYYNEPTDEIHKLVYAYCAAPASTCNQPNRWQRVDLGRVVQQVQLALTRDGRPRILTRAYQQDFRYLFFAYGECDSNCLDAASWRFADVAELRPDAFTELYTYLKPMHYFALDPQDRPRFVFNNNETIRTDTQTYERGGNYAQCDADCTNAQSWTVSRFTPTFTSEYGYFSYDEFVYPSLAFTSQGAPRIVAHLTNSTVEGDAKGMYYFGCDSGCDSGAGWTRTRIADRGAGIHAVWDVAVDSNDRPHVAYYEEPEIGTTNNQLYYLSCASDCERGGAWNTLNLGLPSGAGDGVDIALDTQGRPRMAYLDGADNLAYSWCNATCESAASWQHTIVEARSLLDTEYPISILPLCSGGFWNTLSASLSLDPQGNPRVAYRATFQEQCFLDDPGKPSEPPKFDFKDMWHSIRVTVFQQP